MLSVVAALVLALVVGGVMWFQNRDSGMVPYTISLPHKILDGGYYKKKDLSTICSHCLTSDDEIEKLGIKKGFPWSAYYVQNPAESAAGDPKKRPTISVIGIQGKVAKPVDSVDAVLARMHKDDAKNAKALGVKIEVIEGTKVKAYTGDTFDGTTMKCESVMMKPKQGLDNDVTVSRCVWGDTSAVGIVQQQGVGVEADVMHTNDLTDATTKIRNEVRQPHPKA
ncbi:hypothetical protein SNA_27935 [Streptomyces natalensis ATCC 27448]|uniref:Uncharacterized protein n=1 Tax=Streptomyces natalensis ATCC 27448 TaxID=1240678 RepID=A0A0D7CH65_9ACTN|nr:hypothetical protein SNA_27935 [Streptomyces natalensis ATCC 27448]